MRVCVLQSAYPDNRQPDHDPGYHPEFYIHMHSFEHRWIRKDHAMQDIESALEEKFDVYFNLIWGQFPIIRKQQLGALDSHPLI